MVYVKWVFWGLFWLIVVGFLHYSLPQRDIVRIVNTYEERQDVTGWTKIFWAASNQSPERLQSWDVQFIQAIDPNGDPMVYRNEDTGWIYPPYFKFDSSDLQAEAENYASTAAEPEWVVITHYGWRINFGTIYPNAVSVRPAPGPDYRPFPWVNLVLFAVMIAGALFLRAMWRQFRERTLDPLANRAEDRMDHVQADLAKRRGRFRRWLDSWKSK